MRPETAMSKVKQCAAGSLYTPAKNVLVRGGELHGEVRAQGLLVHGLLKAGMLMKLLNLTAEQQIAVGGLIVAERLDAEDVTRAKELARAHVVHHEAVHATQAIDQAFSPLLIAVHEDLGVGVAVERVPRGLELGAELLKVVDLAVEHHEDRAVPRCPWAGRQPR